MQKKSKKSQTSSESGSKTVYIVSASYDYEDSSTPLRVFSTRKAAVEFILACEKELKGRWMDYERCEACPMSGLYGTKDECKKAVKDAKPMCGASKPNVAIETVDEGKTFYAICEDSAQHPSEEFYFITECAFDG